MGLLLALLGVLGGFQRPVVGAVVVVGVVAAVLSFRVLRRK